MVIFSTFADMTLLRPIILAILTLSAFAAHSQSYRGLCVISDKVVWVSGSRGTVLRTKNGGKTWDTISPSRYRDKDFRDIHAWNSREAVIMSSGDSTIFLKTRDGGKSWYPVYVNYKPGVFFDDLDFNGDRGMAVSDPLRWHKSLPKEPAFLFVESTDRGENWFIPDWLEKHPLLPNDSTESMFAASGSILELHNDGLRLATGGNTPRILNISFKYPGVVHAVSMPVKNGAGCGIYSFAEDDMGNITAVGGCWSRPDMGDSSAAVWDGMKKAGDTTRKAPGGYRSSVCFSPDYKTAFCTGTNGTDISRDGGKSWETFSQEGFNVCRFSRKYLWLIGRASSGIRKIPLKSLTTEH